jgi:hypothetical protein
MANQIISLEIPGQVLQRRKRKIIKLIAIDLEEYKKEAKRRKELEDAFNDDKQR